MSRKKNKNQDHPTLFVLDGSVRHYENGSMLELHSSIRPNEWELIVEETIKYKIFLECLKETAFPTLDEQWNEQDEWFRLQLDIAVSRIKNIDPILAMKWNEDDIKKKYTCKIAYESKLVRELIDTVREQQRSLLNTKVSDL